ncbi:MAG: hypothetical protein EOM80_00755 [Erysipelotrichia bacterium]|nr:hypothetical protein [Erysipelotrichia bacterium]
MTAEIASIAGWFRKNNPLYLLSVVLMLAGLYLVGSELETGKVSVLTISGFFAIQNLYEIVMIGMALYLLKKRIQPEHGKLLLVFVLLFLGDLTFYQVRISGLNAMVGGIATTIYIVLAIIKFAAVVKVLALTVYRNRIFYVLAAFILVWVSPKIAYFLVDSIGRESFGYFDGSYVFYSLWLIAGLIHLPLIIENWKNNQLNVSSANEYLGNETSFWRWLIIFPFILLPLQMFLNLMSGSCHAAVSTIPVGAVIAPWLLGAAFFAQTLWRHLIKTDHDLNVADSIIMLVFVILVMLTSPVFNLPVIINHLLLFAGLIVTWVTRNNAFNACVTGVVCCWYSGWQMLRGANYAVSYASGLSRLAWAGILMAVSFVMLLAGFVFSISRSQPESEKDEAQSDSVS